MAAYKTTRRWVEDGGTETVDIFIVADTYAGTDDLAAAIEVDVYGIESTKDDLDVETGLFAAGDISFTADGLAATTDDDAAAVAFVLDARTAGVRRYCGRVISPANPDTAAVGDYAFRGVVRREMSADDVWWGGTDYESIRTPVRTWKASAGAYDVEHALSATLDTLIDGGTGPDGQEIAGIINDDTWLALAVADRLGYFRETIGITDRDKDDFGTFITGPKEARWGNLVSLSDVIQRLLTAAAPPGVTITYQTSSTNLRAVPARFVPFVVKPGWNLRYVNRFVRQGYPAPYRVIENDTVELLTGGDADTPGSLYVSWRLLTPTEEETAKSWRRYGSLAELLYELAAGLGMFVQWEYVTGTEIVCRFAARADIASGPVYIRDAKDASIDVKPVITLNEEQRGYVGSAWQYTREGPSAFYRYGEEGFTPAGPDDGPATSGTELPLTLSPTWCLLDHLGFDAGYPMGDEYGMSWIPHGAVFWNGTGREARTAGDAAPYNRAVLHSGIYVRCTGRADDGSIGVNGLAVWAPAYGIISDLDGAGGTLYTAMSEFRGTVNRRDEAFFDAEYTITVPGLSQFRTTAPGPGDEAGDWRACRVGRVLTLDGVDYVLVGVERKLTETVCRFHARGRFDGGLPGAAVPANDDPATSATKAQGLPSKAPPGSQAAFFVADADILAFTVVSASTASGSVRPAEALRAHYGRIVGFAEHDAAAGEPVRVRTTGRITGAGHTYIPGTPLYLRSSDFVGGALNWTDERLAARSGTEDLHVRVGTADTDGGIVIGVEDEYVYWPPIS